MNNINIDKTIEHVENIVKNNQCSVWSVTNLILIYLVVLSILKEA